MLPRRALLASALAIAAGRPVAAPAAGVSSVKIRLSQRAALFLGPRGVALDLGRARRLRNAVRDRMASRLHRGRWLSALCLAALYVAGMCCEARPLSGISRG